MSLSGVSVTSIERAAVTDATFNRRASCDQRSKW